MDYTIDKADKEFQENFEKLQRGGLDMVNLNGIQLLELKEFHRRQTLKGGLTSYTLPEIKKRKHTKFIPDSNAPVFKSLDEIDLKFEINRINDPGSLAPRERLVKNKASLERSQREIVALRGQVKDILCEEHPPIFEHPSRKEKHEVKVAPEILQEELDFISLDSYS